MPAACTNCGTPLQWDPGHNAWYCPQEGTWAVPAPGSQGPSTGVVPAKSGKTALLAAGLLTAVAVIVTVVVLTRDDGTAMTAANEDGSTRNDPQGLIDGKAIAPVATKNITFVAPKPGVTWAEMAFPCFRAAIEMGDGGSASDPFYQASPMVEPAFQAAGIRIDQDIAAIGGWDCGEGPCFYLAATLENPKKIGEALAMFAPDVKESEPLHWAFEAPGANGTRTIGVRVLPIQWGSKLPDDAWSRDMAKATHVIFLQGLFGGSEVELASALASGEQAADRIADVERVLDDTRGRCAVGTVGPTDFKPGFALTSSHFALGLPPARSDAIARMMNSQRSMNLEIEFALSAAATEADVARWMEEARVWMAGVAAPIRAQFAGQGEMVQVMFDAAELIATQGLRHKLDNEILRLSWRTDRVKESSLVKMEAELQRLQGPATGF